MKTQAEIAVSEIIEDLAGRFGLGQEWEHIEEDIQEEIKVTWTEIIARAIGISIIPPAGTGDCGPEDCG